MEDSSVQRAHGSRRAGGTMILQLPELAELATYASEAARAAGAHIAASRPGVVNTKPAGTSKASQVVTDVDRDAERLILATLAPTVARFDLGVLSEEIPDDGLRLTKRYFWCIDPLDGTLAFVEGQPGFAVSIALVARNGVPVLGVVFDPVRQVLYQAIAGHGVTVNERPWAPVAQSETLSLYLDRSWHEDPNYQRLVNALGEHRAGVAIHTGAGAVMNACLALDSPPACYFKFPKSMPGGGSVWDFAATACVLREAGAVATDICGQPLDLNRRDSTFMNHRGVLFATDASLAAQITRLYRLEAAG